MTKKLQNKSKRKLQVRIVEILVIVILSFIAYANAIYNDYNIDDAYIVPLDKQNDIIKEGVDAIPVLLKSRYNEGEGVTYGYRPMGKITMVFEYMMWGNNPVNSHIVNIFLFSINVILLLFFLRMLFVVGINLSKPVIYLSLLLFIFHPIHTEVVCSIKNREEILCFAFLLCSLMSYLKFLQKSNYLFLIPFIGFLVVALLSKQTAFNIFGWIILLTAVGRKYSDLEFGKLKTATKGVAIFLISFIVYNIIFVQFSSNLPYPDIAYNFEQNPYKSFPASHSVPNGIYTLFFYVKKLIFPYPLLFYYGYDMLPLRDWSSPLTYVGILIIVGLLFFIVKSFIQKAKFEFPFFIAVFTISIFPFSNLFTPIYVTGIVGERLIYQASFAFCVLLAIGLFYLAKQINQRWNIRNKNIPLILLVAPIISIYATLTLQRSLKWEDKLTLYENDIKHLRNSVRANSMIASTYMKSQDNLKSNFDKKTVLKAKKHFNQSVKIYPKYNEGWLKLATVHAVYLADLDSAIICLNKIEQDSSATHIRSLDLLGDIFLNKKDNTSAFKYYKKYWSIDSSNYSIYQKIQNILFEEKRYENIIEFSNDAISNKWVVGFVDKGDAFLQLGNHHEALKNYQLAIENGFNNSEIKRKIDSIKLLN